MRNNSREKSRSGSRPESNSEAGYALLMVIFMVATMLLFAVAATPSVIVEGRRLREQEDVWRGNQYVRAIRLYSQKTGRYPQTVDDLTKPDAAGNHFLRKTYADLMNSEDGKWRMIYVSPSGQLIGSVRYHSLQEMALAQSGLAASLGTVAGGAGSAQAMPGQSGQAGQSGQPGQTPVFGGSTQPQSLAPLEPVDGPVLGGFLIGVGGKEKKPSLMVYQGGKTYYEWEFIWNPLAAGAAGGAPVALPGATVNGAAPGTAAPGATPAPGTAPAGTAPAPTAPGATAPDGTTPGGTAPGGTAPAGTPPATAPPPANPPADPNAPAPPAAVPAP